MANEKILIVEDEYLIALDTREQLVELGYQVVGIASSSEQAEMLSKAEKPDLILMDIHIKGETDGITTAAILRGKLATPIIFITAHSDSGLLERAQAVEPYGYLIKPVTSQALKTTVHLALFQSKRNRQRADKDADVKSLLKNFQEANSVPMVCSSCHAIRDPNGSWLPSIHANKDLPNELFSHGLCPDCTRALYGEI